MPQQNTPKASTDATQTRAPTLDEHRLARLKTLATEAAPDTSGIDWGDPETWRGLGDLQVASYLAATRPSVMLALLADRDRLAAELADAREAIKRLEADNDRISTMLRISLSDGADS